MVSCLVCNQSVYMNAHRIKAGAKFCSREHANIHQGRKKLSYTCKVCGKSFLKSPSFEKFGKVTYCSQKCYHADPETTARLIANNHKLQEGKRTKLETAGYGLLDSLEVSYIPQRLIANKFCVDALVNDSLIIQFDGDYWHGNPSLYTNPDARQLRRMRLDKSQDAYLRKCGFTIIRIWESEIRESVSRVKERIISAIPTASA